MNAVLHPAWISEDDYLQAESRSLLKHEYVDGHVYAMSGASRNHQRIATNLLRKMGDHLDGHRCEVFAADIKVKTGSQFFYPDVMVVCEDDIPSEYYTQTPILIVEVLSKSTRRMDETTKRLAYFNIPTLLEYVLIEQDIVSVEVCRRTRSWRSEHYFMGDQVHFDSIDLTLSVEAIYARVDNDEMRSYREHLQRGFAAGAEPPLPAWAAHPEATGDDHAH